MNRDDILNVFRDLARSQGSYGRMLAAIEDNPEAGEEFLAHLEEQSFTDPVDLILYIEG